MMRDVLILHLIQIQIETLTTKASILHGFLIERIFNTTARTSHLLNSGFVNLSCDGQVWYPLEDSVGKDIAMGLLSRQTNWTSSKVTKKCKPINLHTERKLQHEGKLMAVWNHHQNMQFSTFGCQPESFFHRFWTPIWLCMQIQWSAQIAIFFQIFLWTEKINIINSKLHIHSLCSYLGIAYIRETMSAH